MILVVPCIQLDLLIQLVLECLAVLLGLVGNLQIWVATQAHPFDLAGQVREVVLTGSELVSKLAEKLQKLSNTESSAYGVKPGPQSYT